jgi:endonuclease/exonuclease/phosphatase family metal-dependent hydrolase
MRGNAVSEMTNDQAPMTKKALQEVGHWDLVIGHSPSVLIWYCVIVAVLGTRAFGELPGEIRVVTYNIHHGEGVDRRFDLKRIANLLLAVEPHVVALQEVDQGTRRASGVDQPAELAKLTGMKVVFGRNIDFEGGGYGTAVLTKLPVRKAESVKLKSFYPPTPENPEQRGVQVLELGEKDEAGLLFLCTHLDYRESDEERMASAKTINELVAKRGDELAILAGDLNAEPGSGPMEEFRKEWKVVGEGGGWRAEGGGLNANLQAAVPLLTFPAERPGKWIDYVLVRPAEKWEVVEVRVIEEAVASDHRPLLAVVRRVGE